MSLKLFALNFASLATAQVTTALWYPGVSNSTAPLSGSLIAKNGDTMTVSLDLSTLTADEAFQDAPATVTFAGTTLFEYQLTLSDSTLPLTRAGKCSRKDDKDTPVCQVSTVDYQSLMSDYCNQATSTGVSTFTITETYESDSEGPASTETATVTYTNSDTRVPSECSSINPEDAVRTISMSSDDLWSFTTYQLVLTAGTEKLSAAATPSGGASPTAGSSSAGPSGQLTGAAPIMTAAPVLAGLGAAAAAIFL